LAREAESFLRTIFIMKRRADATNFTKAAEPHQEILYDESGGILQHVLRQLEARK
jgi:hypothetical protein